MSVEFRLAKPSDYEQLEDLVLECFRNVTFQRTIDEKFGLLNGTDWRQRWRMRFRKAFDTETVYVGEAEGKTATLAVGRIQPDTKLGYINILAVDERFRGRGYGRQALRHMLVHLKQQGAEHAYLDCLETNIEANRLYESEGFQEVGRSVWWFIKIP